MYKYLISFFLFLVLFLGFPMKVQANEPIFPYSVNPLFPANQNKEVMNYYHLFVTPGKKQELAFLVVNKTDKPVVIDVFSNNALTSPTGDIQYLTKDSTSNAWITDSLFYMKNKIHVPAYIELKPKEQKKITFSVQVPSLSKGEVLGAISFKERKENIQSKENITIQNEYAFILAMVLEVSKDVESNFHINKADFPKRKTNPNLEIEMENPNPNILQNIKGSYKMVNKKMKINKTFYFGSFKMAPKTKILFPTEINPTLYPVGTYDLYIEADINGKKVEKKLTFKINDYRKNNSISTEKESNKKIIIIDEKPFYQNVIFWVMCSVILVLFFILIFKKNKK